MAAGPQREKTDLNIFTERIKSGLKDLEAKKDRMVATLLKEVETRKKQTEKSLSTKAQEARDRLDAQAKTEHDKFTTMSPNNMSQCTANL
jgi:hypothetical protein